MGVDSNIFSQEYAREQDSKDELRHLRSEFLIPSKQDLQAKSLLEESSQSSDDLCTYLCGNSLGVQPRRVEKYVTAQLKTWATKGVHGHFQRVQDSPLVNWVDMDAAAAGPMARIVGAREHEVAVMQTLTANLHLLMAAFYRPTQKRYKIILESKAFPSDHFAVESQLAHHRLDPNDAMILLSAPEDNPDQSPLLPTEHILSVIDAHAESTALLLLPGIQFYTGQLFDIKRITAHAQAKGIVVGWDLAHAAGNALLELHDWNVDFAAWCTYKYLNCGPGSIGALFVHDRHAPASDATNGQSDAKPRLTGWWGSSKETRFNMDNKFVPMGGAAGFQLSNPSALDLAALTASMSVFDETSVAALRRKSERLTQYLQDLLLNGDAQADANGKQLYKILTPLQPEQRGAQLSVLLAPGLLDGVMHTLTELGVVLDERKPDVIRVAPAPLYNNHEDVWRFYEGFRQALRQGRAGQGRVV